MKRRDDVIDKLRQRLVSDIHFGTLTTGARLPSARKLASELRADPRVVLNAFARLETEGLVRRNKGERGYVVAAAPPAAGRLAPSTDWMVEILERALAQGIHATDFAEHVRRSLETVRLCAACIECNTDQLDWICRELGDDYGIRSTPLEIGEVGSARAPHPALQRADIIVTTAAHAAEMRRAGRQVDKPVIIATLRREVTDEVLRLLRLGPVYFICADMRYANKLKKLYAGSPGAKNLRTVVLGWHDPSDIPEGSPIWMLRAARAQLGGVPSQLRAFPTLRLFSAETTRALLTFVLRANATAAEALPPVR